MKLVRDLSALFALLVSISVLLRAQPESRGSADFYLGIAFLFWLFCSSPSGGSWSAWRTESSNWNSSSASPRGMGTMQKI